MSCGLRPSSSLSGYIKQKIGESFATEKGTGLAQRRETLTNSDQAWGLETYGRLAGRKRQTHQIKLQAGQLNCVTTCLNRNGLRPPSAGPPPGPPKISRFFFPLPPQFSFFLLSLWGPFAEFWWFVWSSRAVVCEPRLPGPTTSLQQVASNLQESSLPETASLPVVLVCTRPKRYSRMPPPNPWRLHSESFLAPCH